MKTKTSHLKFSDEELNDSKVNKAYSKAEKAVRKADKAKDKIKSKTKLVSDEEKKRIKQSKLRFGSIETSTEDIVAPSKMKRAVTKNTVTALSSGTHKEVSKNEDDNVGVESVHKSEELVETTIHTTNNHRYGKKLKVYQKAEKLERKADKANINVLYQKQSSDSPNSVSNPISKWRQKQAIKKEYMSAKTGKSSSASSNLYNGTKKTSSKTKQLANRTLDYIKSHGHSIGLFLSIALMLMFIASSITSCSVMFQGGTNAILGSSYIAEDDDIIGANNDYKSLEANLRDQIDNIESTHPNYDEYRYDIDNINHNPHELTSYLTVVFDDYSRNEVQRTLTQLFYKQYKLTLTEEIEVRTRTETRTGIREIVDPETGETYEEEFEYDVEVEYDYYILNVKLKNKGLGTVIAGMGLNDKQMERYVMLLQTQGNRSYLFEDDIYANPGPYEDYDIPGEALTDERFANMVHEAEKYLGYPYVWGGSSPSTSFDCSGYVSWVINHCGNGWNVGRLSAQGLMNICDIVRPNEAKPGDLIFFQGTYDTAGASHVGIYVGNNMMIHCGNPISYASLDNSYWQAHFYCYGRLP